MTDRGARQLAHLRVPRAGWIAALMAALAVPAILYLGRHLSFIYDEWTFVFVRRGSGATVFFGPHNEHWSTIPVLIYGSLFRLVGLRTYLPYLAVLELLHAGSALLLFMIIRRRAGSALGLAAMLLFLLLGRGGDNILWAFQIGFVGSVFCGLAAIWLLDVPGAGLPRVGLASLLLVASLMFSGVGLFFCAGLFVDLVLDRDRRWYLASLIVPTVAYLGWFLIFGRLGLAVDRSPLSLHAIGSLDGYVPFGIGAAIAGLAGLSSRWGTLALAVASALLAIRWYQRRRIDSRMVGALAGVVAQFAVTGLVRAQFGDEQAASTRYVYVAAAFLLPVLADAMREVRWEGVLRWALAAAYALALLHGALVLRGYAADRAATVALQRAELQTISFFRGAPDMSLNRLLDPALPPIIIGEYFSAVDALGSPVPSVDLAGLRRLPPAAVDRALWSAFAPAIRVDPAVPLAPAGPTPNEVCAQAPATSTAYVDEVVPDGKTLRLAGSAGGTVGLGIAYLGAPDGPQLAQAVLTPRTTTTIHLPDTGKGISWKVRLSLPSAGTLSVCTD